MVQCKDIFVLHTYLWAPHCMFSVRTLILTRMRQQHCPPSSGSHCPGQGVTDKGLWTLLCVEQRHHL